MKERSPFLMGIGDRINKRRKQLDLTQEELAFKADISPQVLSTAIRGEKQLKIENLVKISEALEVSADYILTGDIVTKDITILSNKLDELNGEQYRYVEEIIDLCLKLRNET